MQSRSTNPGETKKISGPKISMSSGVIGIRDPKWIFVALCYLAAIALMGLDPWFGDKHFTYNQGSRPINAIAAR